MTRLLKILFFWSLALSKSAQVRAQIAQPTTWKKRVGRTIDVSTNVDTAKQQLRNAGSDSMLSQMFIEAFQSGKLTVYSTIDASLSQRISKIEFENLLGLISDTSVVVDPITGEEVRRIRLVDVDYDKFQKFRILEDWTFYPATGRTETQIVGVGPVRDVYGSTGDYRGQQTVFWLKYSDAKPIIDRYDQYHPDNTVAGHIWGDYFLSDIKPKEQK